MLHITGNEKLTDGSFYDTSSSGSIWKIFTYFIQMGSQAGCKAHRRVITAKVLVTMLLFKLKLPRKQCTLHFTGSGKGKYLSSQCNQLQPKYLAYDSLIHILLPTKPLYSSFILLCNPPVPYSKSLQFCYHN